MHNHSKGDWSWIPQEATNRGLTVPQLARLLDVEPQAVRHWINGRNAPHFPNALKLAVIFFSGSVEQLAERAGFSRVSILREVAVQMESIQAGPTSPQRNGELVIAPVHLPAEVFNGSDPDTFKLAETALRNVNDLLRRTGAYRALQAQAVAVVRQSLGRETALAARMWHDLAYAELMLGHYPQSLEAAQATRESFRRQPDPILLADSHWLSSECLRIMGNLAEAQRHCEEAGRLHRKANVPFHSSGPLWATWNLARIATAAGRYDQAQDHFETMTVMAQRGRHHDGDLTARWGTAYVHEMQSDFDKALGMHTGVQDKARARDDPYWQATAAWRIAEIMRKRGRLSDALATAETARATFHAIGNPNMASLLSCTLAACHLHAGESDKAQSAYAEAARQFAEDGDEPMLRMAQTGLRLARLVRESMNPAPNFRRMLAKQPQPAEPYRGANLHFETYEALALAEEQRLAGHVTEAHGRFAEVAQRCTVGGHPLEYAHALLGLAEAQRLLGHADPSTCQEALKAYRRLRAPWGQIHALIALTLSAPNDATSAGSGLHEASTLARKYSFKLEDTLVASLRANPGLSHLHPMLFV